MWILFDADADTNRTIDEDAEPQDGKGQREEDSYSWNDGPSDVAVNGPDPSSA